MVMVFSWLYDMIIIPCCFAWVLPVSQPQRFGEHSLCCYVGSEDVSEPIGNVRLNAWHDGTLLIAEGRRPRYQAVD